MSRLLLLVAIVAVGWYLYRQWNLPDAGRGSTPGGSPPPPQPVSRCLECGVHVPENNGVRYQNMFFCCPEHMNSWLRKQGQP